MNRAAWAIVGALIAASMGTSALGAEPAAPVAPPAGEKIAATVKTVEGTVETRPSVGDPWVAVKPGQQLAEGADLRTGFRARCVLDMTDSLVQVDPLTVVRIGELRRDGDTVRTRLIMKQGNTEADVEKGRIKSDFVIVTPSATLSVRGTQGVKAGHFQGVGSNYQVGLGSVVVTGPIGESTPLSQGQQTNNPGTPAMNLLAQQNQNPAMDPKGLEKKEKNANGRRNNPSPLPPLSPMGSGPIQTFGSIQQNKPGLTYAGPPPPNPPTPNGEDDYEPEYEP